MDASLLRTIWPVFSAETRDQLQTIGSRVLELEQDPSTRDPEALVLLKRVVHSLKGSAASLGLSDIEKVAHAIEDGLAAHADAPSLPRGLVDAVLRGVSGIEAALARGDAGEAPDVEQAGALLAALGKGAPAQPATTGAGPLAALRTDGLGTLEVLETSLGRLCSPHVEDRPAAVSAAVTLADQLKAAAEALGAAQVAQLAAQAASTFARMMERGEEAGRAASDLTSVLLSLRGALEAPVVTGAPAAAPRPAAPGVAAAAAPAALAAPAVPTAPGEQGVDRAVRVSVKTLDSLALQVEHLAAGRAQLQRKVETLQGLLDQANRALLQLERSGSQLTLAGGGPALEPLKGGVAVLRGLQKSLVELVKETNREGEAMGLVAQVVRDDLRDLRMVPASQVLEPLRRTVREVGARLGKDVELVLTGGDVRLDRRILDALKDPLGHLVRNAMDHGVEGAEARRQAGKAERGRIQVRVEPRGTRIAVVVEDDGAGLNPEKVRASAVRKGLLSADAAARLSEHEAARLVFQPGFSTKDEVTSVSGRGVGLDVVLSTAVKLQGSVDVDFTPGHGTRFTLDLPLTLAAALGLLVRVGTNVVALPSDAVLRVLRLAPEDVGTVAGRVVVRVDGEQLPFHSLAEAMKLPRLPLALDAGRPQPALLLGLGDGRVVFAIDEIAGQQEVVVRPLGKHLSQTRHLAGATVLDDGRVVPVLNAGELIRAAAPSIRAGGPDLKRARVLVCDDALTTRFAMKSLLEIAGYSVVTAGDGQEGWELLERGGADLVVSDWQMPRLDGVGLTRRIKANPRFQRTPVVLVTSLDSPEDRAAGLEAGADGYLVKKDVERGKLLDMVRQLMPRRAD